MRLERFMTDAELGRERVSRSYFGRLVGVTRTRVTQLISAGLLDADDEGILLVDGLRHFFGFQSLKGSYDLRGYVRKFCSGR